MPITATIATLAGLSMAGFAPLNGFLSKEMMLEDATHAVCAGNPLILPAVVTLGAVFSAAYSFRYVFHVFFGPVRHAYQPHPPAPTLAMALPPGLLVVRVIPIRLPARGC